MGVIHGDIKPDNILVSPEGHLALADFGHATLSEHGYQSGGGDVRYVSPETLAGDGCTEMSDVWSMGISVLEMYMHAANPIFDGQTFEEIRTFICSHDIEILPVMCFLQGHYPLLWDLIRQVRFFVEMSIPMLDSFAKDDTQRP